MASRSQPVLASNGQPEAQLSATMKRATARFKERRRDWPLAAKSHAPGPWAACLHLDSDADNTCSCGYRGGIWGADGSRIICEMGSSEIPGEEGLAPARYDRATEIANARLIVAAPELLEAARDLLGLIPPEYVESPVAAFARAAIAKAEAGQ